MCALERVKESKKSVRKKKNRSWETIVVFLFVFACTNIYVFRVIVTIIRAVSYNQLVTVHIQSVLRATDTIGIRFKISLVTHSLKLYTKSVRVWERNSKTQKMVENKIGKWNEIAYWPLPITIQTVTALIILFTVENKKKTNLTPTPTNQTPDKPKVYCVEIYIRLLSIITLIYIEIAQKMIWKCIGHIFWMRSFLTQN